MRIQCIHIQCMHVFKNVQTTARRDCVKTKSRKTFRKPFRKISDFATQGATIKTHTIARPPPHPHTHLRSGCGSEFRIPLCSPLIRSLSFYCRRCCWRRRRSWRFLLDRRGAGGKRRRGRLRRRLLLFLRAAPLLLRALRACPRKYSAGVTRGRLACSIWRKRGTARPFLLSAWCSFPTYPRRKVLGHVTFLGLHENQAAED